MQTARRLDWLDAFRGLAVLWMIETHAVNAFLESSLRQSAWFAALNFCNGLVAPSFLFIAGYAQGIAPRRAEPVVFWKKMRRLGVVALIGYALHFPAVQIWQNGFTESALRTMLQVDILQCLAASLALMLVLDYLAGKWSELLIGTLFIMAVLLVRPAGAWAVWPLPVAAFVNQNTGSLFPLFPWIGFACAGFLASRSSTNAAGFLCAGPLCEITLRLSPTQPMTNANPFFFFERLGWVLVLVPLFIGLARLSSLRLLVFAGRQSLVVYVAHLLAIYFAFVPAGSLANWIGQTQTPLTTALLFLAILAISLAAAQLNAVRADRARRAARLRENLAPAACST